MQDDQSKGKQLTIGLDVGVRDGVGVVVGVHRGLVGRHWRRRWVVRVQVPRVGQHRGSDDPAGTTSGAA